LKINWKVRFKNKVWLSSFISAIIALIYTVLDMFCIFPEISENTVVRLAETILFLLSIFGILIDPTTAGFSDSKRAQGYEEPWNDANCDNG
jgi:phi LC3 family holin